MSNSDASRTSSQGQFCNICMKSFIPFSVAAVLDCGHVFHADCLEKLTSDVDKYDPECPRCTHGNKDLNKLILNLGNDNKINKSSKKHVDKLRSNSAKGSFAKSPFLKRYLSEGESSRKKGFFARFRDWVAYCMVLSLLGQLEGACFAVVNMTWFIISSGKKWVNGL